jgi:acetyl coenzyme A synthetase (ADP forming)-like protein
VEDVTQVRDVILQDGGTLRLRRPEPADGDALLAFFAGLSDESLRLRFRGAPALDATLVERYLDSDSDERGALVGMIDDRVVALGSFERLRDPSIAEVAFAVDDPLQGRGVGTRLLEQLAEMAATVDIDRFVAEVEPSNAAMLSLFRRTGFEVSRVVRDDTVEVGFAIAHTDAYAARVDERDHLATVASLRPFFAPTSIAVVGASRRQGTIGNSLFRNVLAADFGGAVYPVNLRGEPVGGVRAYRSVAELPEPIDLTVICVPAAAVLQAAEQSLRAGCRALCVISAGFAETGREGAERQTTLLTLARAHGARVLGPNCLGISVAASHLNATFAPRSFPPGTIGFSSQSGALGLALLENATSRRLGLSAFVSVGNKLDISTNDLLEYWELDDATQLVLLYVESFGNPRKFSRVAHRVARRKPVLAMKSGTSRAGARAAGSHTAALAGSNAAVDALFREAGVLRADTLEELLDVASLLSRQPLPEGRRVGVLTNAGGLGILCADACEAAGLELPSLTDDGQAKLRALLPEEASVANPVDALGSATAEVFGAALPVMLADPGVDAVIALFAPAAPASAAQVAVALSQAAAGSTKPVLAVAMTAEGIPAALAADDSHVTGFAYPESAARALGRAVERAEWLRRPSGANRRPKGIDARAGRSIVTDALRSGDGWLEPDAVRRLLECYGLPVVPERIAETADQAVAAAIELGMPVAVKLAEAGAHKTERGGVELDLADAEAVAQAAGRIGGRVVVQPMIRKGVELLMGIVQDPVFGPLVALGPGGVLAELIGEAGFRIAPITDVDAQEMIHAGKTGRLVEGFRGAPPVDADALADLLLRLSAMGDDLPELVELDLNPVIALPDGCVVVDSRARVATAQTRQSPKTW